MTKIHYSVIAIIVVSLAAYMVGSLYAKEEAPEPIVEEIPPVIIQVDNVGCVIAEVPVITYYVATDTARVTIECDSDLLFNYLPAVE
jgi:predicted aconitase with swiveling domain